MLLFYLQNPGQGGWYVGPLLMFLPFLLGSGLLSLPLTLLSALLGGGTSTAWVWTSDAGWQPVQSSPGAGSWPALLSILILAALVFAGAALVRQCRRHGTATTLRRLFLTGFHGGGGGGGAAGPAGAAAQQQRRQRTAGTQQERFERVTQLVQGLPTEVFRSREELEGLSVGELKELLRRGGVNCERPPLEKRELVECLLAGGNSSAASCSICCEDYASGDVQRVLPCGHRYHLECLDRWLLSSTDYSRPPACPMCNAELGAAAARGTRNSGQ